MDYIIHIATCIGYYEFQIWQLPFGTILFVDISLRRLIECAYPVYDKKLDREVGIKYIHPSYKF